jgi:hypothetical protein
VSSLFLFGAGASYGSGPCTPHNPPLGSQLFSALQQAGGIARTFEGSLSKKFEEDFERGMDSFYESRGLDSAELLRDMAIYFSQFFPEDGNAYVKLIQILGGTKKKAVFATTNYDLLIERAAGKMGLAVSYLWPASKEKTVCVLKIHGSCNFLPKTDGIKIDAVFGMKDYNDAVMLETGVRVANTSEEILEFCNRERSLAPALAAYSPSKPVHFCPRFVRDQLSAWNRALNVVSRVYVIGLRVHAVDSHIWEPLAKVTAPLYYVGMEPDAFTEWAKSRRKSKSIVLAPTLSAALPKISAHFR